MCFCFSLGYSKVVVSLSFKCQLDLMSGHIWSMPPLAKCHFCVDVEKQNVPALSPCDGKEHKGS